MLPVDVRRLGVDSYASSSHKWLLAPKGSGLLYVRREAQPQLRALELAYGFGVYTASTGTRDIPKVLALGVAIDFHNALGTSRITGRIRALSLFLDQQLQAIPGLTRLVPADFDRASGISSYALDRSLGSTHELAERLRREFRVYVHISQATYPFVPGEMPREDFNAFRFSPHIYCSEDQIVHAVDRLKTVLKS